MGVKGNVGKLVAIQCPLLIWFFLNFELVIQGGFSKVVSGF